MMVEGENIGLRSLPYDSVELTNEEVEAALLEAKKKKYFHEKHKEHWEKLESPKGKTKMISYESRAQTHPANSPSSK